jgi:hypothetical protein
MQRQLTAFVEQPCQATYVAARDAVMRRSPLAMVATDFAELERLLSQEAFQVLLDRLDALPASKILSPRIHFLAAEAAEALGDAASVELERSLFVLTLHLPRVLAAPQSPDEWSSGLIALGMCGASWICASVAALPPHPIDALTH